MSKVDLPKLSIVSPSFNQGNYLSATLDSIIAQDYPALEHIVADGGSTDATLATLAEYAGSYGLEWFSEPDEGLYDALNKALARATGSWIGWINCDDLYAPGIFHAFAEAVRANPQAEVVCGDAEVFREQDGGRETLYVDRHYRGEHLAATPECLRISHLNACFFRRELLERVGAFRTDLRIIADRDYLFRLTRLRPPSVHLERIVCRYRAHAESLTMSEVSAERQAPLAAGDSRVAAEIRRLCELHLGDRSAPAGVRRWCRDVLARRHARDAAQAFRSGELNAFVRLALKGAALRPRSVAWLGRYVLSGRALQAERSPS